MIEIKFQIPSQETPTPEPEKRFTISHSQIGVWNDCQTRWKYNYLDKIVPASRKNNFELGILFHEMTAVYDQLLILGLPAGDPLTWERVAQYCEEEFYNDPKFFEDSNSLKNFSTAVQATKRYILEHSRAHDMGVKVLGVEDEFEIDLTSPKGRPFTINGYIDRLYLESGKTWLLDRKTSGTGKHYNDNELMLDPQLLLYAAVYRQLGYKIFGVAIDSVSTYPYANYGAQKIDHIMKRLRSYRTDIEQNFILNYVGQTVDEILDKVESGSRFSMNLSRACARCPYMEPCLYEIKGIDPEYLIANDYVEKTERQPRKPIDADKLGPKSSLANRIL